MAWSFKDFRVLQDDVPPFEGLISTIKGQNLSQSSVTSHPSKDSFPEWESESVIPPQR
jgi:hypothetical protein